MTSLNITDADIPPLDGKVAVVTGGSSGIGLATTHLLAAHSCRTFILDLNPPPPTALPPSPAKAPPPSSSSPQAAITFIRCDTSSWTDLQSAFKQIGPRIDIAIANAGVSETTDYFEDRRDETGALLAPEWDRLIDVNFRGVLCLVKLAIEAMRKKRRGGEGEEGTEEEVGGSIVITASATAYAPEQSLPVYSATKHALIGLVRSLRSTLPQSNISINAVCPAATITSLLPANLAKPLLAAGLPVSTAAFVARAIVYSATARQGGRVEDYGKDKEGEGEGKWNGRAILTLGTEYTEIEGGVARLRNEWFGEKNTRLTKMQQAATDFRVFL